MSAKAVFQQVNISVSPADKSKYIDWYLDPSFCIEGDYPIFYVEVARATDEWTRLNPSDPIINNNWYVDDNIYQYSVSNDIYYRIVLDDQNVLYRSDPTSISGNWNAQQRKIARTILKNEFFRMTKQSAGVKGNLLKRRLWGTKCTECKDYDLEAIVKAQLCTSCYGTGIVGGYYDGYPVYLDFTGGEVSEKDIVLPFAVEDLRIRQARCIAHPLVSTFDLWHNEDTNERYVVKKVQTVSEIQNVPLIYQLILIEIPPTRIEYEVPIDQDETDDEPASWRTATDFEF